MTFSTIVFNLLFTLDTEICGNIESRSHMTSWYFSFSKEVLLELSWFCELHMKYTVVLECFCYESLVCAHSRTTDDRQYLLTQCKTTVNGLFYFCLRMFDIAFLSNTFACCVFGYFFFLFCVPSHFWISSNKLKSP